MGNKCFAGIQRKGLHKLEVDRYPKNNNKRMVKYG